MVSVRNRVKRYSCACGAHRLRIQCARAAQPVRTEIDFCRGTTEELQRHCNSIADSLQYHCNAYAINIHPTSLLLAVISLHLRNRHNSLLKTHATHYGHNHNVFIICDNSNVSTDAHHRDAHTDATLFVGM